MKKNNRLTGLMSRLQFNLKLPRCWKRSMCGLCFVIMEMLVIFRYGVNYCGNAGFKFYYCSKSESCCDRDFKGVFSCCEEEKEPDRIPPPSVVLQPSPKKWRTTERLLWRISLAIFALLFLLMLLLLGMLLCTIGGLCDAERTESE